MAEITSSTIFASALASCLSAINEPAAAAAALAALPPGFRACVVLCDIEGLTYEEVAEILDVPEGTVRTRLMHAKKKLRVLIEQEGWS